MTITVDAPTSDGVAPAPRGHRRRWYALTAALVVVAVATTVWIRHYADAPALRVDSSEYTWVGIDGEAGRNARLGSFSVLEATARPGHDQSFEFWVHNPSSVTQTVLGLRHPGDDTAEPSHVLVSTIDPSRASDDADLRFVAGAVDIPPHRYRAVRYVLHSTECWTTSRSETFTDVRLRVRVGAFTRTETVSLGDRTGFVLTGKSSTC